MRHTLSDGGHVGLGLRSSLSLGISLRCRICPDLGGSLRRGQSVLDDFGPVLSLRRDPYPGGGEDLGGGHELGHVDGFCT